MDLSEIYFFYEIIHLVICRVELSEICFLYRIIHLLICRVEVKSVPLYEILQTCSCRLWIYIFFCFTTYYPEAPSAWLILTPIYKVDMQIDGHVSSQENMEPGAGNGKLTGAVVGTVEL